MASYWSPRRLLDDASDVLDTVLHPLANHTDEEAREKSTAKLDYVELHGSILICVY